MKISLLMMLCVFQMSLYSETIAYTEDGRKIQLNDDKTWSYVQSDDSRKINTLFRNMPWGSSIATIKSNETATFVTEQEGIIGFSGTVAGFDALIVYIVVGDKLTRGKYILQEKHMNGNDHISDYNNLKEMLTKKYGTPETDKTIWKNSLYKDDTEHYGTAISVGHLVYYAKWKLGDLTIALYLHGDNFNTKCEVEYSSQRMSVIEKAAREKSNLGDL